MATEKERLRKRRMRAALKRAQQALLEARLEGYDKGWAEGGATGRNTAVRHVLLEAGALFQQGKDTEANAVRAVHSKLAAQMDPFAKPQ